MSELETTITFNQYLSVDSAMVSKIAFGGDVMGVVFATTPNVVFIYRAVTPEMFIDCVTSKSIGKWITTNLKGNAKHPFTKQAI